MAINKRPAAAVASAAADAFIGQAPDAPAAAVQGPSNAHGKQSQITLTLSPELLSRVDAEARRLSISRAGYIKMSLVKSLDD